MRKLSLSLQWRQNSFCSLVLKACAAKLGVEGHPTLALLRLEVEILIHAVMLTGGGCPC
jgi:hypothetical protein